MKLNLPSSQVSNSIDFFTFHSCFFLTLFLVGGHRPEDTSTNYLTTPFFELFIKISV